MWAGSARRCYCWLLFRRRSPWPPIGPPGSWLQGPHGREQGGEFGPGQGQGPGHAPWQCLVLPVQSGVLCWQLQYRSDLTIIQQVINCQLGCSLHACGSATDLVISKCVLHRAAVVSCPCCYGGVTTSLGVVSYPRSQVGWQSKINLAEIFRAKLG